MIIDFDIRTVINPEGVKYHSSTIRTKIVRRMESSRQGLQKVGPALHGKYGLNVNLCERASRDAPSYFTLSGFDWS